MKLLLVKTLFFLSVTCLFAQNKQEINLENAGESYAKGHYQKSLTIYKQLFDNSIVESNISNYGKSGYGVVQSLLGIANTLNVNGDYFYAEIYLKLALFFNEKYKILDADNEAYLLLMIGRNYGHLSNYSMALKYLKKALAIVPAGSLRSLANINMEIAYVYYQSGDKNQSFEVFKKAISLFEKEGSNTVVELSRALQRYGIILLHENNFVESEQMLLKSYEILLSSKQYSEFSLYATNHLGYFYKQLGEYEKAIQYFQLTINNLLPDFRDTNIYAYPEKKDLAKHSELLYALRYKAHAFYLMYKYKTGAGEDLEAAIDGFDIVFDLIDYVRTEYNGQESGLFFADSYKETTDNALNAILEAYNINQDIKIAGKVFDYIERSKSSLLYLNLYESRKKRKSGVPQHLIMKEKEIESKISLIKLEIDHPDSKWRYSILIDSTFVLLKQLEEVKKIINQYNTREVKIPEEPSYVSLQEVKKSLDADEVMLEYSITDSLLISFFIDSKQHILIIDTVDHRFHHSIVALRKLLEQPGLNEDYQQNLNSFCENSYYLYQKLLQPYEQHITNRAVVIIPDDKLLYIPFEILIRSNNREIDDYRNLDYFLYYSPVSYTYSAALKYGLKERKFHANNLVASFAPGYSSINTEDADKLDMLPFAKEETEYISDLLDGDKFCDSYATERSFVEKAANYGILHLALHTSVNDSIPMLSKFYFSCVADSVYDNNLDLFELNSMDLNARLVVLSGCNTGYGHLYNGEGLYNLARGFIQAGSPSLVLSLWDLNDYSGYKLIKGFYDNLSNNQALDVSMQNTKIEYLRTANKAEAHPFFWSAYISIGDQKPIEIDRTIPEFYIIAISLVGLIVLYLLYRIIRYRKTKRRSSINIV